MSASLVEVQSRDIAEQAQLMNKVVCHYDNALLSQEHCFMQLLQSHGALHLNFLHLNFLVVCTELQDHTLLPSLPPSLSLAAS